MRLRFWLRTFTLAVGATSLFVLTAILWTSVFNDFEPVTVVTNKFGEAFVEAILLSTALLSVGAEFGRFLESRCD